MDRVKMRFCLIFLCFVWGFAYDYSSCKKYYKIASNPSNQTRLINIEYKKQKLSIGFFKEKPKEDRIIKEDPFIGLYAFAPSGKGEQNYLIREIDERAMKLNMASIAYNYAEQGIVIEAQKGYLEYGRFTAPTKLNGVISNICYQIYGLGMGENLFIDGRYLFRFLEQKEPYYGDIGIRLYPPNPEEKSLKVQYVDPFFPNVPFIKDDEILSINDYKFKDYYDFEWFVTNLPENSKALVEIRRGESIEKFEVQVSRRYGGFLLPDRFFERLGITLDDNLTITNTDPNLQGLQQGLLEGDTILWINNQKILSEETQGTQKVAERLRYLLTQAVSLGKLDVLISRGGFQFTLNLINGLNNEYIQARNNPFGF